MIRIFVIAFFLLFSVLVGRGFSNKPPVLEVLFDSSMLIQPYTNRGVGLFTLQAQDSLSQLYWKTERRITMIYNPAGVFIRGFLTGLLMNHYHLGRLLDLGFHELGHGTRGKAFGYAITYSTSESDQVDSYYRLLYDLFAYSTSISTAWTHYHGRLAVADGVNTNDLRLILSAGGVNNEMYLAQLRENRFYDRRVSSVYDFFHYLSPKLAVDLYVSYDQVSLGDMDDVQDAYQQQYGINITDSDLKRYNGYAILLSSSFWAFLDGWSRYVVTGIDHISYYEKFGFRLPDVNFFLTSHGPSYHVQSGYRFKHGMHVPFAVEYVFLGEKQYEYTVGLVRSWTDRFQTRSNVRFGEALGGSLSICYSLLSRIDLNLGVDFHHFKNLYGERHVKTLLNGNRDMDLWFNFRFLL